MFRWASAILICFTLIGSPLAHAANPVKRFIQYCSGWFITPKQPWEMTQAEWVKAGQPNFRESFDDSFEGEVRAINAFIFLFPDPIAAFRSGGTVPEIERVRNRLQFASKIIPKKEQVDAREAILIGRRLKLADEDILFYVIQTYIIQIYLPNFYRDRPEGHVKGWDYAGLPIPEPVKREFPALAKIKTF